MPYDFSKTEAAQPSNYLEPGIYEVKITKVELGEFSKKKTSYLGVTFENEDGQGITEKFPLSEAALGRLQYLHEAWANKKLDKVFKSAEELETYFTKTFVNPKAGKRKLLVGGEISNTDERVYGRLPYSGFIVTETDVEIGPFEEDSPQYKKYVKRSNLTSETDGKKNGILNDDNEEGETFKSSKNGTSKKAAGKAPAVAEEDENSVW